MKMIRISKLAKGLIYFTITYLVRTLVFYISNFNYDPFSEGFNLLKFLIDFGIFATIYTLVLYIGEKISQKSVRKE